LAEFPESRPLARFKNRKLSNVRFCVLPPFNRWLIFYQVLGVKLKSFALFMARKIGAESQIHFSFEKNSMNAAKEFELHIN
jgi:hypothetical protein